MVLTIRQTTPAIFNLYSVVEMILAGTLDTRNSTWTHIGLYVSDELAASVEGYEFEFDEDGYLVAGTVTALWFGVPHMGEYVEMTGLSLDIATARLSPPFGYPVAENPTIDYSAVDFHPGYDPFGHPWNVGVNFSGGAGDDTIRGSKFPDELNGLLGNDRIYSGDEDDWLFGGGGRDTLDGGAGFDWADYSDKSKPIALQLNGNTYIAVKVGTVAEDTIRGIEGILGGSRGDKLIGDSRANNFVGNLGTDVIDGGGGIDGAFFTEKTKSVQVTLAAASYATVKVGGIAEDKLRNVENVHGGKAGDKLTGDSKGNLLAGYAGADTLMGGSGSDHLFGGAGKDVLVGGPGTDYFYFGERPSSSSTDVIRDFDTRTEKIVFSASALPYPISDLGISSWHFRLGTAAKDYNDFVIYDRSSGKLYVDNDASGPGKQVLVAILSNKPVLDSYDFAVL